MNFNIIAKGSDYIYDPEHKKHPSGGYHKTEKGWSKIEEKKDKSVKKHKEVPNGRKIEHDFRTVQRECLSMSDAEVESYHSGSRKIDEGLRGRLQGIFRRKLAADSRRNGNGYESLVNPKTNKPVKFHKKVSGDTFHSIFEMCHKYLPMGDCVDVHDKNDYENTDNYMSEDGMSGFSITKEGDLISVFSLSKEGGFLSTIAPVVKEKAKTLDCFNIGDNGLPTMYEKYFGFQTASVLEFNEDVLRGDKGDEYTDNFIKNYGKPSVHFMVNSKESIESKKFDKDDWDGAFSYQQSKKAYKIISRLVKSFIVNKIAKNITKSYSASKDVDQIRDNGGKSEYVDLSKPSRTDLKKTVTKRDVLREDKEDYNDTLFDKDLRMSKVEKVALKIAGIKKIEKDFEKEIQKAIESNETIAFDYINKQGKYSLVQLTPTKIENKWGKKVVTGITKYGKEFSFLFDSIGKKEGEESENKNTEEKKEKTVVLPDDCDFEKEIEKAIKDGNKIQFSYLMKNGNRTKITMKPTKIEKKWGQDVCTGDTYSGERSYLISSMGNNSMAKTEMFKEYPFLKDTLFYGKFNGTYYFFKPIAVVDDKIECDKIEGKTYTSYYTDGDVEDKYYSWEQKYAEYKTYPKRTVGQVVLEIKNDTLVYENKELKKMSPKSYLTRSEPVGEMKRFEKSGYGWVEMK